MPNKTTIGPDLAGTGHQASNFKGRVGAAGDTWISVYDPAANPAPATFGSVDLSAEVLIDRFTNMKGAGLLALYNEAPSTKGLALTLYSAGNTDSLVLATVDQAGKLGPLKAVSLGAAIKENVWYRVSMELTVDGDLVSVIGTVFGHETPTTPYSALTAQVGVPLTFSGILGTGLLVGVGETGEVGVLSAAVATKNGTSVTNILIDSGAGGSCSARFVIAAEGEKRAEAAFAWRLPPLQKHQGRRGVHPSPALSCLYSRLRRRAEQHDATIRNS